MYASPKSVCVPVVRLVSVSVHMAYLANEVTIGWSYEQELS